MRYKDSTLGHWFTTLHQARETGASPKLTVEIHKNPGPLHPPTVTSDPAQIPQWWRTVPIPASGCVSQQTLFKPPGICSPFAIHHAKPCVPYPQNTHSNHISLLWLRGHQTRQHKHRLTPCSSTCLYFIFSYFPPEFLCKSWFYLKNTVLKCSLGYGLALFKILLLKRIPHQAHASPALPYFKYTEQ